MKRRVVLLVEDHIENRIMYRDYLRYRGFEVLEAKNGADGLRLAQSERPDVILMDLSLPRIDGCTVTRRLKESRDTVDVPVIAITASCLESDRERALAAGCDAYLPKPFLPQQVCAEIERLIGSTARPPSP